MDLRNLGGTVRHVLALGAATPDVYLVLLFNNGVC
jgi:hypothetical protein